MHRANRLTALALGFSVAALGTASGCNDNDACKGRSETCLSITLDGVEGVAKTDRLEIMVQHKSKPDMPMMALESASDLPFKVAVLWPDGAGSLSVRSYLGGTINGVTAEVALDLRNGVHEKRRMTLFPPLPGQPMGNPDMRPSTGPDMRMPPKMDMLSPEDMKAPEDMAAPDDLSVPTGPDLSVPPANDM